MAMPPENQWKTLDKDLRRIGTLELAARYVARPLVAPGLGLVFLVVVALAAAIFSGGSTDRLMVIAAAVFGAYMALNIGANDVANNMGPAVGAKALSMGWALVIAAVCEVAGALIAGIDVVQTIAGGILDIGSLPDQSVAVEVMLTALLAAALWLNLATWIGASISTTHSIVGGIAGAGIAAAGLSAVNWGMMGQITLGWVISPLLGGAIAAGFLAFINDRVVYSSDRIAAARFWVPKLIGVMAGSFAGYLVLIGFGRLFPPAPALALPLALGTGVLAWVLSVPVVRRQSEGLENRRKSLRKVFGLPLIFAGALLSFGHGANDVSNAVGPLAAVVHALGQGGHLQAGMAIPLWVMMIGATGISFGLLLFGPKLIRLVGSEITNLNPLRAFCVALSTAITVLLASAFGMPVSSTHIAVGAIFGVGFFREWHARRRARKSGTATGGGAAPEERFRRKLVRRSHVLTMCTAWMVTVPSTALLSGLLFLALRLIHD